MKRITIVIITILIVSLLCVILPACEPIEKILEYEGTEITQLTFRSVASIGEETNEYIFDFRENTASKRRYVPYGENGIPEFEQFASFNEEKKTVFINKCYTYGLFSIEEHYENPQAVIMESCKWNLTVEYADGTSLTSSGDNNTPYAFNKCAIAFDDLCKDRVVGSMLNSYYGLPNINVTFEWDFENGHGLDNGLAKKVRGKYRWKGIEASRVSYYDINQYSAEKNSFLSETDYRSFSLSTLNYSGTKFSKLTLTSYDFNEAMTNKTELLSTTFSRMSSRWSPPSVPFEYNKIYVYRLIWKNGDYVEYTFNTCINNDITENA